MSIFTIDVTSSLRRLLAKVVMLYEFRLTDRLLWSYFRSSRVREGELSEIEWSGNVLFVTRL